MKTSPEEALGKGQQCLFVSLIKKHSVQEKCFLWNAEERSPLTRGYTAPRGHRAERCQEGVRQVSAEEPGPSGGRSNDLLGSQNAFFPDGSNSLKVLNFHDI